jgi:hypothetical protein
MEKLCAQHGLAPARGSMMRRQDEVPSAVRRSRINFHSASVDNA